MPATRPVSCRTRPSCDVAVRPHGGAEADIHFRLPTQQATDLDEREAKSLGAANELQPPQVRVLVNASHSPCEPARGAGAAHSGALSPLDLRLTSQGPELAPGSSPASRLRDRFMAFSNGQVRNAAIPSPWRTMRSRRCAG